MVERVSMEETQDDMVRLSADEVLSLLSRPVVIDTGDASAEKQDELSV
jgi:hypothetical protein